MAQRSLRRDRDNQLINQCREHVCLIWTRSADSHPGPRPVSRMTGRTHGSPDHALHQTRRFLLRHQGRLHMVDNAGDQPTEVRVIGRSGSASGISHSTTSLAATGTGCSSVSRRTATGIRDASLSCGGT